VYSSNCKIFYCKDMGRLCSSLEGRKMNKLLKTVILYFVHHPSLLKPLYFGSLFCFCLQVYRIQKKTCCTRTSSVVWD
jgi:hypothetical protein